MFTKKNTLKSLSRRKEIALIVGWIGWAVETNLCICIFFSANYSGGAQGGPTIPWHPQYFNCTWSFYMNSKLCVINLSKGLKWKSNPIIMAKLNKIHLPISIKSKSTDLISRYNIFYVGPPS